MRDLHVSCFLFLCSNVNNTCLLTFYNMTDEPVTTEITTECMPQLSFTESDVAVLLCFQLFYIFLPENSTE